MRGNCHEKKHRGGPVSYSVAAFLFVIAGCGKENKHPDAKRIAAEEFGMEEI